MGSLLRRLLGKGTARREAVPAVLYSGDETLEVVGESHYQDDLWRIVGGRRRERVRYDTYAVLVPDPGNKYDENAIEVRVDGFLIGYLSREDAATYRTGVLQLMQSNENRLVALEAAIVGGGMRADGMGFLGVFLDHDPADFGLPRHHVSTGRLRTGLSEALATDLEDDSYDLSWLATLNGSDRDAIARLRTLLQDERDPIDRHYMLCELESRLYRCRDEFETALEEFDAACSQHDEEMVELRPALVQKFGVVPVIEMYRQAAIRWQKAKDWEAALGWAERGIAVYGDAPARREAVEDLQKRVAYATAKIEVSTHPRSRKPRGTAIASTSVRTEVESLVCTACGETFERRRARGRKPKLCPRCREATAPVLGT